MEALSVGTPVIASNRGGLPEIIKKVDRKLIFDDWATLKNLISNFSKRDFSPVRIRTVYEKYFSPEAYFKRYFQAMQNA